MISKVLLPILIIMIVVGCNEGITNLESTPEENKTIEIATNNTSNLEEEKMNDIKLKINDAVFSINLVDNSATNALIDKLKIEDVTIKAHDYGGFEKVGDLGFSLPREDTNITTSAGDIVLYQGNQISLFYNSNSWSYTKIGRIKEISDEELKEILGNGDVTITFTLSR